MVLTERGAVKCRSIQRRPESERWSQHLLSCTCSVLQPNPLNPGEVRVGIKAPIHIEPSDGAPIPPTDSGPSNPRGPQRTRLMAKYFRDFGFTEGCPGCNTRLPGRNLLPEMLQNHSEACRSRIESCLAGTTWGQARLNHARDRITQRIVDMSADKGRADSNRDGADPSSDLPGGPPQNDRNPTQM